MFSIFRSRSSYCSINPYFCHQFYGLWNRQEDPTNNTWWCFESGTVGSSWSIVRGDDHNCHGSWGEDQVSVTGELWEHLTFKSFHILTIFGFNYINFQKLNKWTLLRLILFPNYIVILVSSLLTGMSTLILIIDELMKLMKRLPIQNGNKKLAKLPLTIE